ncbi:MAG: M20/M25/M40 family metallo-hydrolase [Rhodospirillaceae bacterium]|nr:M20/M25/M40 family metallo-hydrolase [Rhodospirillaceae bacterium]
MSAPSSEAACKAAIAAVDAEQVVSLSQQALRIRSLSGEEEAVARFFVDAMRDAGMDSELQPVPASPNMGPSFNAIGRFKGAGGGKSVMFNGHIDHNPVCDGWTKDPYGGIVEKGWLYGFVHMKAANACYVAAVDAVRRAGIALKGDVAVALVCGELRGGAGTQEALKQGLRTDYFVLGEPTELDIALNHTASIVLRIHVLGRMKHFATVDAPGAKGVNAVEKMAKVIAALGRSHTPFPPTEAGGWLTHKPAKGFEGLPQINIGPIRGGIGAAHDESRPALLPDRCTLIVDVRIVPGMSKETIRADLDRLLGKIAAADEDFRYEIEFAQDTFPLPFDSPRNSPIVDSVVAAHRAVNGAEPKEAQVLKFAASDASWLSAAGIPGIIYGPTGRYLSRADERCETVDLVRAAKAYACVIADICTRAG